MTFYGLLAVPAALLAVFVRSWPFLTLCATVGFSAVLLVVYPRR